MAGGGVGGHVAVIEDEVRCARGVDAEVEDGGDVGVAERGQAADGADEREADAGAGGLALAPRWADATEGDERAGGPVDGALAAGDRTADAFLDPLVAAAWPAELRPGLFAREAGLEVGEERIHRGVARVAVDGEPRGEGAAEPLGDLAVARQRGERALHDGAGELRERLAEEGPSAADRLPEREAIAPLIGARVGLLGAEPAPEPCRPACRGARARLGQATRSRGSRSPPSARQAPRRRGRP